MHLFYLFPSKMIKWILLKYPANVMFNFIFYESQLFTSIQFSSRQFTDTFSLYVLNFLRIRCFTLQKSGT